jgi:hypothetical protein
MVRYHGVFAPASPLRKLVVPRGVGECRHRDRGHIRKRARGDRADGGGGAGRQQRRDGDASTSEAAWRRQETELRYLMGTPSVDTLPPLRARRLDWAALLARVWEIEVLRCPRCDGRMRVIAALSERSVVKKVLSHLELPTTLPQPAAARAPPWSEDELDQREFELPFDDDLDLVTVVHLESND